MSCYLRRADATGHEPDAPEYRALLQHDFDGELRKAESVPPTTSGVLDERSFDAPLRYTVWRGDRYLTVEGPFRQYYYGVDLEPFNSGSTR